MSDRMEKATVEFALEKLVLALGQDPKKMANVHEARVDAIYDEVKHLPRKSVIKACKSLTYYPGQLKANNLVALVVSTTRDIARDMGYEITSLKGCGKCDDGFIVFIPAGEKGRENEVAARCGCPAGNALNSAIPLYKPVEGDDVFVPSKPLTQAEIDARRAKAQEFKKQLPLVLDETFAGVEAELPLKDEPGGDTLENAIESGDITFD
jgi:hypothetical protein